MSDIPYMPLYVNDYEGDTAHLSIAEDGMYTRLLRLCWRTSKCSVPHDKAWLIKKLRINETQYKDILEPIIEEFFDINNGRILQGRQQKEFKKISKALLSKKINGKKGGFAKALKSKEKTSSKGTNSPLAKSQRNSSNQNHNHIDKNKQKENDILFDEFWLVYPKKAGKPKAKTNFIKAVKDGADPNEIIEGAKLYAQEKNGTEDKFIKHAQGWLTDERWKDANNSHVESQNNQSEKSEKEDTFNFQIKYWIEHNQWPLNWGNEPNKYGHNIPPSIMKAHGLNDPNQNIN